MKPKTFNLALREPKRCSKAAKAAFQKWASKNRAQKVLDQQRYADLQGLSTIGTDLPVCMVCAGRSQTWDGHPACRGKKGA